jgi:hypothetical protein
MPRLLDLLLAETLRRQHWPEILQGQVWKQVDKIQTYYSPNYPAFI